MRGEGYRNQTIFFPWPNVQHHKHLGLKGLLHAAGADAEAGAGAIAEAGKKSIQRFFLDPFT